MSRPFARTTLDDHHGLPDAGDCPHYALDGICGIGEATTIGGLSYGVESPEAIQRD
jgi:hypothetical protein